MMTLVRLPAGAATCAAVLILAVLSGSCMERKSSRARKLAGLSGTTMGTTYRVTLDHRLTEAHLVGLRAAIEERLAEIDASMSTYREDSEIARFNASRSTDWIPVAREFAEVVAGAQEISRQTGGAFDITVSPLVDLWGFGMSAREEGEGERAVPAPTPAQLAAVQARTGYTQLDVRLDPSALRKRTVPELQIDLSGIAKGHAVDEVSALLESRGYTSYLVEIGGEVRAGDPKQDGSSWRVGIEAPLDDGRMVGEVIALANAALATSGDYRNFYISEGRRYSHLIDPRTGAPVLDSGLASVSIRSATCREADALATALFILGASEARDFAERRKLSAFFFVRQEGQFSAIVTDTFEHVTGGAHSWTSR